MPMVLVSLSLQFSRLLNEQLATELKLAKTIKYAKIILDE